MERRDFLKILPVPLVAQLTWDGKPVSAAARMEGSFYMLFVDALAVNVDSLISMPMQLPEHCKVNIISVRLMPGETIDDAVRMYEVKDVGS